MRQRRSRAPLPSLQIRNRTRGLTTAVLRLFWHTLRDLRFIPAGEFWAPVALVALVPRWRQDYPDNLTQPPEAMTAEMGHSRPHAPFRAHRKNVYFTGRVKKLSGGAMIFSARRQFLQIAGAVTLTPALLRIASAQSKSQSNRADFVFPTDEWEKAIPAEMGWSPQKS